MGPLLFIAYTIDLPKSCINTYTTCSQFADDTALLSAHPDYATAHRHLQSSVSSAAKWLATWHLLVNVDKTVIMAFHHANRPPPFQPTVLLNGKALAVVCKQRHLGVIIQQDLKWTAHLDHVLSKASKSLHQLRRLRSTINSNALCFLYSTYIRPVIEYATLAVTPLSTTQSDPYWLRAIVE